MVNNHICSRHFLSGKPAKIYDKNNPDCLPTQNLGHKKQKKGRESDDESTGCTSMDQQCVNTSKDVSTQTEETAEEQTSHALEKKLTDCYSFIADLRNRVSITAPFCEESLQKNEDVKFYTVVFDLDVKTKS